MLLLGLSNDQKCKYLHASIFTEKSPQMKTIRQHFTITADKRTKKMLGQVNSISNYFFFLKSVLRTFVLFMSVKLLFEQKNVSCDSLLNLHSNLYEINTLIFLLSNIMYTCSRSIKSA